MPLENICPNSEDGGHLSLTFHILSIFVTVQFNFLWGLAKSIQNPTHEFKSNRFLTVFCPVLSNISRNTAQIKLKYLKLTEHS